MSNRRRLRLDLPLVLPDVDDVEDRCVERLLGTLTGRPGIDEAHVVRGEAATPQLCIHYDPDATSLGRVRELAHAAGADLSARFSHLLIQGDEPMHARSARRLAEDLRGVPGVLEADVAASGAVRIEYDRHRVTREALFDRAGEFGVRPSKPERVIEDDAGEQRGHDHVHGGLLGERNELLFAIMAGTLLAAGWLIERL